MTGSNLERGVKMNNMKKISKQFFLAVAVSGLSISVMALDLLEFGAKAIEIGLNRQDAFTEIDEPKEIELGQGMSAQLLGAAPLVDDEDVQRYVNQVGMWVVNQSERSNLPWRFGVLDEDSINAFAAPGGYIFISKGLFLLLRNESELAGVLAHEIGHVLEKHHLDDIKERAQNGLFKDLAGELVSQKFGSGWGKLVKQLSNIGVEVWESGLNREDEFEADQIGVVLAARAGYDPYGLVGVLDTLNRINPSSSESYKQMHATHPQPNDRIMLLDNQMTGTMESYVGYPISSANLYKFQNQLENPKG